MSRLRNLRNAERATRQGRPREKARLELHAAATCHGTRPGIDRAFLVSRSYLELAQEACRDVMQESTRPEDILRLALHMMEEDINGGL